MEKELKEQKYRKLKQPSGKNYNVVHLNLRDKELVQLNNLKQLLEVGTGMKLSYNKIIQTLLSEYYDRFYISTKKRVENGNATVDEVNLWQLIEH